MSRNLKVAWGSLGVSIVVFVMRAGAYLLTGSVAICSNALETVINVIAAAGALVALWFDEQPTYANDLYKHTKAEYLSAVTEDALVLVTGFVVGCEAWFGWHHPHAPDTPYIGVALNGAAGIINLVWALVLIRFGRSWDSPTLETIGKYLMSDTWTSAAVTVGFALVSLTGMLWLDSTVATLVALNILWIGCGMLQESVGGPR